jgi:hypothetical protein
MVTGRGGASGLLAILLAWCWRFSFIWTLHRLIVAGRPPTARGMV